MKIHLTIFHIIFIRFVIIIISFMRYSTNVYRWWMLIELISVIATSMLLPGNAVGMQLWKKLRFERITFIFIDSNTFREPSQTDFVENVRINLLMWQLKTNTFPIKMEKCGAHRKLHFVLLLFEHNLTLPHSHFHFCSLELMKRKPAIIYLMTVISALHDPYCKRIWCEKLFSYFDI